MIIYLTQEQLGYACTGEYLPGREPGGFYEGMGLSPKRCENPIPPDAQIVIVPSTPARPPVASSGQFEQVTVLYELDYNQVLVSRRFGEQWLLDYGVGCLSLQYTFSPVFIYSPGLFAGIGSKIVIPDRGQECRIWWSEYLG